MTHPNEALMDANYAAWRKHDPDLIASNFTDDAVYEDTAFGVVMNGPAEIKAFAEECFTSQRNFHVEYRFRFANDTHGAGEWTITTTWNGEFEGVDKTGQEVTFSGISIYEFRDGKICRNVDCWDPGQLYRQFGVLPADLKELAK